MAVAAAARVRLQHRGGRLLDLQQQRVVVAVPEQQEHIAAGADAADPDHLSGRVLGPEAPEQQAPFVRQGGAVAGQDLLGPAGVAVLDVGQQRRVLHEAPPVAHRLGQPGQRVQAGVMLGAGQAVGHRAAAPAPRQGDDRGGVDPRVPHVQQPHPGVAGQLLAVGAHRRLGGPAADRLVEPGRLGGDHEAGGQPLDVPLPGAGQGLVEVVETEGQISLRGGEQAEVEQVGVAAGLHADPGDRGGGQVVAITAGAPRRNANGEAAMRAWRTGTSSGRRRRSLSSSKASGDRRPAGSQVAWLERGTALRRARPASARAPAIPTSPRPDTVRLRSQYPPCHARPRDGGRRSRMDLAHGLETLLVAAAVAALAPVLVALLPGPRIPQVVVLLAGGVLIGPQVLGWADRAAIDLLANVGLGFLFLLAGYELDLHLFRERPGRVAIVAWLVTVGLAAALVGVLAAAGLVRAFVPVALGLTTTALGTLLPILRDNDMLGGRFGRYLLAAGAVGALYPG